MFPSRQACKNIYHGVRYAYTGLLKQPFDCQSAQGFSCTPDVAAPAAP